jgi:hypothetical protein
MPVSVKPLVKPLLLGVYRRYSIGVQSPKFPGVAETSKETREKVRAFDEFVRTKWAKIIRNSKSGGRALHTIYYGHLVS